VVIVDTAGRLHVDEELMAQAAAIREAVQPDETLFVIDAMIGQEAVNVAKAFLDGSASTGSSSPSSTVTPAVGRRCRCGR
jgi:signal recognition particle subunit SRP54